jgi:hypothetical protein
MGVEQAGQLQEQLRWFQELFQRYQDFTGRMSRQYHGQLLQDRLQELEGRRQAGTVTPEQYAEERRTLEAARPGEILYRIGLDSRHLTDAERAEETPIVAGASDFVSQILLGRGDGPIAQLFNRIVQSPSSLAQAFPEAFTDPFLVLQASGETNGYSRATWAAYLGDPDYLRGLHERGLVDLTLPDENGWTPVVKHAWLLITARTLSGPPLRNPPAGEMVMQYGY